MILIVDRTSGYWRGQVFDGSSGLPVSGVTASLLFTEAGQQFKTSISNSNGQWSFESRNGYALEVVSGSEKVTIEGDQIRVEVLERVQERRWPFGLERFVGDALAVGTGAAAALCVGLGIAILVFIVLALT